MKQNDHITELLNPARNSALVVIIGLVLLSTGVGALL
jgi:hypothetical protein